MDKNKEKDVLPKVIKDVAMPSDPKVIELLAEVKKVGDVQIAFKKADVVKEMDFADRKTSRTVHYACDAPDTIILAGTSKGTANYIEDLVGPCDLPWGFAQFRASGTSLNPQSILAVVDMCSTVGGEVYVAVKHGQVNPPNPNYAIVFAWDGVNMEWVQIGGATPVSADYSSNGQMLYVGNTPSFKYYRYFAVGTLAMGGSNTLGHVWICAFMVIS
ncbi:MAG: hypothetical protein LBE76_07925 [Nitrososphaerota archaeon]|nr:hypothetical protein [Nitrososphaerota archaeon]